MEVAEIVKTLVSYPLGAHPEVGDKGPGGGGNARVLEGWSTSAAARKTMLKGIGELAGLAVGDTKQIPPEVWTAALKSVAGGMKCCRTCLMMGQGGKCKREGLHRWCETPPLFESSQKMIIDALKDSKK
jgi:hypothetical protein